MLAAYKNDVDMMALLTQASEAYGDEAVSAALTALATLEQGEPSRVALAHGGAGHRSSAFFECNLATFPRRSNTFSFGNINMSVYADDIFVNRGNGTWRVSRFANWLDY